MNAEVPDNNSTVRWSVLYSALAAIQDECEKCEANNPENMSIWFRGYAAGARRLVDDVRKLDKGLPHSESGDVHVCSNPT